MQAHGPKSKFVNIFITEFASGLGTPDYQDNYQAHQYYLSFDPSQPIKVMSCNLERLLPSSVPVSGPGKKLHHKMDYQRYPLQQTPEANSFGRMLPQSGYPVIKGGKDNGQKNINADNGNSSHDDPKIAAVQLARLTL